MTEILVDDLYISDYLKKHKSDFIKLNQNYNKNTVGDFIKSFENLLLGQKISLETTGMLEGYCSIGASFYHKKIEQHTFEDFLNANKHNCLAIEIFE